MHVDPLLPVIVIFTLVVLSVTILLRLLKQPYVVAYLLAGVVLGPFGLGLFEDTQQISQLGSIGVVLLLFFVGMEMSLPRLLSGWRLAVLGTFAQVIITVGVVALLGEYLGWPWARSVLLGFVLSLSSTAVVFKMLEDWGEMDTPIGRGVIGILIMQDLAVIPMFICLNFLQGGGVSWGQMALQVGGALGFAGLIIALLRYPTLRLAWFKSLVRDHEAQVFVGMALCFGLALLSAVLGLSTALGAFVAGIVVSATKETASVQKSLHPFRVVFLAVFFVSVGMLIDLNFLREHAGLIAFLVFLALFLNTVINAVVLRFFGERWRDSFYGGAMLSQLGEFSFVLGAVGLHGKIISQFAYQMTIVTIALSLLVSPFWTSLFRMFSLRHRPAAIPPVSL